VRIILRQQASQLLEILRRKFLHLKNSRPGHLQKYPRCLPSFLRRKCRLRQMPGQSTSERGWCLYLASSLRCSTLPSLCLYRRTVPFVHHSTTSKLCEGQARVQTLKHWPLPFPFFLPIFERLVPHVTKAIDEVNREYGRETLRLGILLIASVLVLNIKIWKEFCVRRFGIFGSFR